MRLNEWHSNMQSQTNESLQFNNCTAEPKIEKPLFFKIDFNVQIHFSVLQNTHPYTTILLTSSLLLYPQKH